MVRIQPSNSSALCANATLARNATMTIRILWGMASALPPSFCSALLTQQFLHNLAINNSRTLRTPVVQERDLQVIQSQLTQNRRVQIIGIDRLTNRFHA